MKLLKAYKSRVANRPDTEHKQALLRVLIVMAGTAYGYAISPEFWGSQVFWLLAVSNAYSISIFGHILYQTGASPVRRVLGAVHDTVATSIFLFIMGPNAALYLFVFPFITTGNGFRFGVKYLAFSGAMAALGLIAIVFGSPAWHAETMVGIGVILSHLLVTVYTGVLLRKIRESQDALAKMATHDALTGLPNRRLFLDRLNQSAGLNLRHGRGLACLYFDLDGFKAVNDRLGHKAGDKLLIMVAEQARSALRLTDVVARLGGDEFTVILDSLNTREDAIEVGKRIISAIESIKTIEGSEVKVSASVGVAFIPPGTQLANLKMDDVVKVADEAMYRAKKSGKGRVEFDAVISTEETIRLAS